MDRIVIVTGASSGIGRAICEALVLKGDRVWACARKQDDLKSLAAAGCVAVPLDVQNQSQILDLKNKVEQEASDKCIVLINNAGIVRGGAWESVPSHELRKQIEVNFFGVVELTTQLLPFIRKNQGRVVNMSSISGVLSTPLLGPYCASKFALEAFTDSLRREMDHFGVKVVSINPGPIDTPIWTKVDNDHTYFSDFVNTEQGKVYKGVYEKMQVGVKKSAEHAAPVGWVVSAVLHALNERNPKTRYFVGKGIGLASKISHWLPDRWQDFVMRKGIS